MVDINYDLISHYDLLVILWITYFCWIHKIYFILKVLKFFSHETEDCYIYNLYRFIIHMVYNGSSYFELIMNVIIRILF